VPTVPVVGPLMLTANVQEEAVSVCEILFAKALMSVTFIVMVYVPLTT
jgi:hypothetical protein